MKLSKREREALAASIAQENEMLKRVGHVVRNSFVALAVFALLCVWGFTGMRDAFFPNISPSTLNVIKWIGVIGTCISLIMVVFSMTARHNGKKNLLKKIDRYQRKVQ